MKRTLLPLFFLNLFLSVSYAKSVTKPLPKSPAPVLFKDEDGDGYGNPYMPYFSGSTVGYVNNNLDCDDTEPTWNPAGTEICDGYDNNCDGNIDEGFATVLYYNDNDHDGYGDQANVVSSCYVLVGRVTNGDDCDDFNPAITTGGTTWYKDADGDSYSDGTTSTFCYAPDGYYAAGPGFFTSGDCDDNDPAINPNTTYYKDADGDGYSDGTTVQSCTPPANYFAAASLLGITGDCDDTKPAINPGAVEICNDRVDNNCDGFIDEGCATTKLANSYCGITITTLAQYLSAIAVSGATDYQYEVRNDGLSYLQTYTSFSSSTVFRMSFVPGISNGNTYQVKVKAKTGGVWGPYGAACSITTNYPVQTTQLSASYCNTTVTALNQYLSATTVSSATNYRFLVTNAGLSYSQTYTSSTNSPVFRMSFVPGVLNGRTYSVQVAAMVGGIWGSYGNACNITVAIPINSTVSLIPDDCNSSVTSAGQVITSAAGTNAESYRFQLTNVGLSYSQVFETNSNTFRLSDFTGIINGTTYTVKVAFSQGSIWSNYGSACTIQVAYPNYTWYKDADEDGYSDGSTLSQNTQPVGYFLAGSLVSTSGDCDDANAAINPGATEICDGIDNDCDGDTDEGLLTTYYRDNDGDGYGDALSSTQACSLPFGYSVNNEDCDDNSDVINPAATEICDGIDNDCDGDTDEGLLTTYYRDNDGDGYGDALSSTQACSLPFGYSVNNEDCDDNNDVVNPAATEICDGIDNDCDGDTDEGLLTTYYRDNDGDGYGDALSSTQACTLPVGYSVNNEDCDDNNDVINPGATEICDGIDNNCDGNTDDGLLTTYYLDSDGDGYGDASSSIQACSLPDGYSINNEDCDDTYDQINPNSIWYLDNDNDGYAETGSSVTQCEKPGDSYYLWPELTATSGDCNDSDSEVNPGRTEICGNSIDDDCDGQIDEGCATTSLEVASCGITIPSLSTTLYATSVSGAQDYRYRVTDGTGFTGTYAAGSNTNSFSLSQVSPSVTLSTTYNVEVSVKTGGVWGPYGSICTVTTPAGPTTNLVPSFCGATITSPNSGIVYATIAGATSYNVEISNTTLSYSQVYNTGTAVNSFRLNAFTGLKNGTAYTVRVSAITPDGNTAYGSPCTINVDFRTTLSAASCGTTIDILARSLSCNSVVGTTFYSYHVTGPFGYDQTYVTPTNSNTFKMSWVNDLATLRASTTYQVEVAVIMNGGIGSYGASCDVTTPPVQTTSLRPSQCGRIVTSPNSSILITPVAGALSYNVELTNTTLGYSQVINTGSSLAYFRFRNFTGITNGATYNVRIAAVTDAGTSDFGTTCAVMANFKTKLSAIYCDTVLTQLNSKLTCNGVVGTTKYHFRVFGPGGYDQTWISTNNSNTFRMTYVHALSPLSPGTAYNVTVKVEMNGGIGPYGDTCVVTTPAIFRLEEDAIETEELNFRAYPNPFRGNLVLELDNTAEVWVRDMTGRIVFHQEKAQGELQIGNELPQGFYLLSVQEGDLRKDLKIIKE